MEKKLKKAILLVSGLVILTITLLFYQWFNPEIFMKHEGKAVSQEEIDANPAQDYAGKIAGKEVPVLKGKEDFEQLKYGEYVTVDTDEIIPTGVYGLTSREDYSTLSKGGVKIGRRVSKRMNTVEWATKWPLEDAHYYQEYYLVKLPDSTYVLTQLSAMYEGKLRAEKEITLPIGRMDTINDEAEKLLSEIMAEYGVESRQYLFMIDTEEKRGGRFLIRFCAAAGVFVLLAAGPALLLRDKR